MTKQLIFALMAQALLALADNKISGDELTSMMETVARMCGFDESDFHQIFIESDGDLHLILKKSALDKMGISL